MNILETIVSEIVGFLGVTQAWDILKTGDYSLFRTYDGVVSLIYPIIPFLLIFELILGLIYNKPQTRVYKVMYLIMPPGWSHKANTIQQQSSGAITLLPRAVNTVRQGLVVGM